MIGSMSTDSGDTAADSLSTSLTDQGGVAVLRVVGAIDLATAPQLRAAVDAAIQAATRGLVIDLTGVDFLASAGMSVLVEAKQRLADKGFAVVADGPATARPLKLTGLDEPLALRATLAEATAAAAGA